MSQKKSENTEKNKSLILKVRPGTMQAEVARMRQKLKKFDPEHWLVGPPNEWIPPKTWRGR